MFDKLKSIGKVLQEAGKIEQYKQILETQKELLEVQKRNYELEAENQKLRNELELQGNLVYKENAYYIVTEGRKDGPFCSPCRDANHILIRLHRNRSSGREYCPTCKTTAREGTTFSQFRPELKIGNTF